tara:strand:+ start:1309 stop:1605 length:297 start_codon:yes stop_codon:yes gene_type:complete
MNRITSSLAFNEIKYSGQHKNQKDIIVDVLIYYPKGLSLRELCEKTGFDINAVSGRVNDLKKLDVVEEMEKRKCSITNRTIIPVTIKNSQPGDQLSFI